jgi:hypothetical protein
MTPRLRNVLTICLPLALAGAAAPRAQTKPATADRAHGRGPDARAEMQSHYAEAVRVHDAVVRGDLAGARQSAQRLGSHAETGLPDQAAPFASAMQQAATRAAQAADITTAGTSAAAMLGTCGECHRAVGAMPAVETRPVPTVGQTVGHMLNHQRATEQLMQGLVVPSSTSWNEGAQALRTAPLGRGKLPKDPKLTSELMAGERRLHQMADRAAGATGTADRAAIYGEMIGTCASCHSLHPNVWGPGERKMPNVK